MANQEDVRRIALSLPGAREAEGRFAFSVENTGKQKAFVWVWLERVKPKKPRVPCADVVAVRVRGRTEKLGLLASDPEKFFTEPHYDGFPAVLVHLPVHASWLNQVEVVFSVIQRKVIKPSDIGDAAAVQIGEHVTPVIETCDLISFVDQIEAKRFAEQIVIVNKKEMRHVIRR